MPGAAGQLKKLYQQIIGGTAPAGAASSSGDISQMVKYLIANPGGLKKVSGSGYLCYPSATVGVDPSLSSGAWANNSWAEVVASTGAALYVVGIKFHTESPGSSVFVSEWEMDIGTGGAGAETVVSKVPGHVISYTSDRDKGGCYWLPYPIAVATSTRIAVRTRLYYSGYGPADVKLIYINQSDLVAL